MAYQKIGYAGSDGSWNVLKVNSDGSITVNDVIGSVILDAGDVNIGAVEIQDDNTGSRLDVVVTGIPSTYTGTQLVAGAAEIGSTHITDVDGGTIDTVTTVSTVSSLTAGSVQLQTGTSNIGSVSVESKGYLTLGSVYTYSDDPTTIGSWLQTLSGKGIETVDVSYCGVSGSLTAMAFA